MKKNRSKYAFIPIVASFTILFILSAILFTTMSDLKTSGITVNNDSAYDGSPQREYDFVESEDRNGVKYYVITKNPTTTTTSTATTTTAATTSAVTTTTSAVRTKRTTTVTTASTSTVTSAASDIASVPDNSTVSTTATTKKTTASTTRRTAAPGKKIAYLTFDDGPSINTEKILDILDQYDAKATFFVIYHKKMESKYKAIVKRGHTIALHSYTHTYSKIYKSEKGYYDDLNKIHDYVQKVTGVDSRIIRFPGGSSNTVSRKYNKTIMKTLKQSVTDKGYYFHDWNVDSTDAAGINRDPDLLVSKVKAGAKKKNVINVLMHDTGKSKNTTVEALPRIIEYLQSQGYKLEPLTEDSVLIQHKW